MSMNRIDQYPGRGSGSSCRARKNPVRVTTAAASQMIAPMAKTHGVDPDTITMRPTMPTDNPRYPTRRAQTAILQCPLRWSSGGSSMPEILPDPSRRDEVIHVAPRFAMARDAGSSGYPSHCADQRDVWLRLVTRERPLERASG